MSNLKRSTLAAALFALGLQASTASAQPKEKGRHHSPPPEAFAACKAAAAGDACTFSGRDSEDIEGTCNAPPQGDEALVCTPEGGPTKSRDNK